MRHSKPAAVIVVTSFVLWACSAAPTASSRDDEARSGATSRDTSKNEKSPTPGETNGGTSAQPGGSQDPQAPAGACTAAQGEDACYDCCEAKHPKGSEVIEQLVDAWLACACAPTACATQCAATACSEEGADPVDGDACDLCLQNTPCDDQFESACQADANCAKIATCESACFPEDEDDEDEEEEEEDGADADRAHAASKAQRIASMYSRVPQLHRGRR